MRRTVVALALALLLVTAGCATRNGGGGDGETTPGTLREAWVSDTESSVGGNHHAVAAGRVDGEPVVYVPIGGRQGNEGCGLVALDGDGNQRWRHQVPPANCTIHAVADPSLADFDGDGTPEVFATTTERAVFAFHPLTGEVEYRQNLTAYGYTHPVLADVTGDDDPELVTIDVDGTLFVMDRNGTVEWRYPLDAYAWAHLAVADFDGDEDREVVAALGNGSVVAFGPGGTVEWHRQDLGTVTWMTTGAGHHHGGDGHDGASGEDAPAIVVTTSEGTVVAMDGTGETVWTRDVGELAAVRAYGDGDGDGAPEVYVVDGDSTLRAVDAGDGSVEWTQRLTDVDVQMTPPPVLGDVDGDDAPELVAASNDGRVSVVDPEDGSILAAYDRDAAVFTHPTLSDTDGDGTSEIYVMYGDGRAVSLTYEEDN
jgi:outer membrane protein assembly factor BamB